MCRLLLLGSTGPRAWGPRALRLSGSRAQARHLRSTGFVALHHVGSSWTRDRPRVPCIAGQILHHWTIREILKHCHFQPKQAHPWSLLPPCPSQPDLLKQTEGISPRWCPGTPVPKPLPGCPSHSRVKAKLSGGLPAALSVPWPGLLHSLCSQCISHKASQLLAAHRMCASGPLHRL